MTEIPLTGNVTAGVVRVGDTVRRPAGPWTDAVDAVLTHLHDVGFPGSPRPLGRDERGRQVLEFVPGSTGAEAGLYAPAELRELGRLLRELHDALAGFTPPPGAVWQRLLPPDREELVCHNDVAPWNLVRNDRGWVLIDWDCTAPASREWDLAYAAQTTAGLRADRGLAECAARLRAFTDGYGLEDRQRAELPATLGRRARAMHDFLRANAHRPPWARIWLEDGAYWRETAEHLDAHQTVWREALR
ncbi:phosphotransferase enzyme family protein [Amycolatopsis sp. NPDC051903]|uniref:phosphotransferase enzyme family protein n=1 Tax=Amycolatopsis sp. NPDC051903 TaxID=3363936 RepID=UPI00378FFBDA